VHHAHVLESRDWTLPRKRPDGSFENIYRYVLLHWPWRYARHLWHDFAPSRAGWRTTRRALQELLIFAMLWSIPFWIDAQMALWLWLFPHWIGNAVTMGSGMYVQHVGCRPKSKEQPVSHSNSFRSRFFNLTMFNIGYHVEHHDQPGVHWADLPALHERRAAELHAAGARYVDFGYYGGAHRIASTIDREQGLARFEAGVEPPPAERRPLRETG
jgi:fatty acid desaturase